MTYHLAIGDRAYSSWSLRGWLMLARFDLPADIRLARLYSPEVATLLAEFGGARTVPALRFGNVSVWDTLAMAESLAERHPEIGFWPAEPMARGLARSLAAETHSSFGALRSACPMNLRRAYVGFEPAPAVLADLARLEALWRMARELAGPGPWLFGDYSLADVFFAPIAARIATYDLAIGPEAADYVAAHIADPHFVRWRNEGLADPVILTHYDMDLPERPWPGPER